MRLTYLTDVEGIGRKWEAFCADNPLLHLSPQGLCLERDAQFVFGGDAVDRGADAQRIVAQLTELKLRHPEQVVLLGGNRDINKLRLGRELSGYPLRAAVQAGVCRDDATHLRWIFSHTMGAQDAFEHRRTELENASGTRPDDQAVVDSFRADVSKTGALTQYLALCQLAFRQGSTLFVHGGLGPHNLGKVPSSDGARHYEDLDEWVEQLNGWYKDQIAAYIAGALEPDGSPCWQPLVNYQAPAPGLRENPQSVVYFRHADAHNDPRLPEPAIIKRLVAAGIHRVVVGHMPAGDTPSLLRDPALGFELLLADNSYARVDGASQVFLSDEAVRLRGQVILDDRTEHHVDFTLHAGEASPLGLAVGAHGPLVKAPLTDGRYLTFKALPKYKVEQQAAFAKTLEREHLVPAYQ